MEVDDISRLVVEEYHKRENVLRHFSRFEKKEAAMMNMIRLKQGCQPRHRPITTYVRKKRMSGIL